MNKEEKEKLNKQLINLCKKYGFYMVRNEIEDIEEKHIHPFLTTEISAGRKGFKEYGKIIKLALKKIGYYE